MLFLRRTLSSKRRRLLPCLVMLVITMYVTRLLTALNDVLSFIESISDMLTNSANLLDSRDIGKEPLRDDGTNSFSACLLVMDENHRLVEWLSYHYYALNLRYLIVGNDPYSRSSPRAIFDRWKDRITIREWSVDDYMPASSSPSANDNNQPPDNPELKYRQYLTRQQMFYNACTWFLWKENRTWTSYHDADEFIITNADVLGSNVSDSYASRPGFVLTVINELKNNQTLSLPTIPPYWNEHFSKTACATLPRALYSAVESTPEKVAANVPAFVKPRQFDTLRWRYRSSKRTGRGQIDGLAKSIIDVSRLTAADFAQGGNAHRPLKSVCPSPWIQYNDIPLGIHHYLGSWEAYSYREDARKGKIRSYDVWMERSVKQDGGPDDEIRPWMAGFVAQVGQQEASRLLQDAGLPKEYKMSENATAEWRLAKAAPN